MSWKNPPTNFSKVVIQRADKLTKDVAKEALIQVITRSPVDTGAYRGNHRVAIDHIDLMTDKSDTSSPLAMGLGIIESGAGIGKILYISNNLEYAPALENGHSQQAPYGVYTLAFKSTVDKFK